MKKALYFASLMAIGIALGAVHSAKSDPLSSGDSWGPHQPQGYGSGVSVKDRYVGSYDRPKATKSEPHAFVAGVYVPFPVPAPNRVVSADDLKEQLAANRRWRAQQRQNFRDGGCENPNTSHEIAEMCWHWNVQHGWTDSEATPNSPTHPIGSND